MGNKLKAISKVSVALALLGAAVPAVEAAPTAMAAKKTTKKAKKSTKKSTKKAAKKAVKKTTKKVTKKSTKKVTKKSTKKTTKKSVKKTVPKTTKKPVKKVTPKTVKTAKKSPAAKGKLVPIHFESIWGKVTDYYSKNGGNFSGMARLYNLKGKALNYYVKKGDKIIVYGQTTINGQLMYDIYYPYFDKYNDVSFRDMWVPAKEIQVDYFSTVKYSEDNESGDTPAERKANYDADLALAEKTSTPKNQDGLIEWFEAHPLEDLRQSRDGYKVSKSTYEKHNISFAQKIADNSNMGAFGCYTEESYKAYMKGEKAYREYEAKWAAKYPNITKTVKELFDTDSYYKKNHLNTFEWHFNDNYYTVDNIKK